MCQKEPVEVVWSSRKDASWALSTGCLPGAPNWSKTLARRRDYVSFGLGALTEELENVEEVCLVYLTEPDATTTFL